MKSLQQLFAALVLALALSTSTIAGEMSGPASVTSPVPPPAGCSAAPNPAPPIEPGDTASPGLTELTLELLMAALSMH